MKINNMKIYRRLLLLLSLRINSRAIVQTDLYTLLVISFKVAQNSSVFCIHASGVLDFLLDRTALWVGGLRKVGIDFAILDYIEWLGFRGESSRASF